MWVRPTLWTVKCLGDELLAAGDYRVGRNEGNESCLVCSPASLSLSLPPVEKESAGGAWMTGRVFMQDVMLMQHLRRLIIGSGFLLSVWRN